MMVEFTGNVEADAARKLGGWPSHRRVRHPEYPSFGRFESLWVEEPSWVVE